MKQDAETTESNGIIEVRGGGLAGIEIKLPASFILDNLYEQDPEAIKDWICKKFHIQLILSKDKST